MTQRLGNMRRLAELDDQPGELADSDAGARRGLFEVCAGGLEGDGYNRAT